MIKWSGYARSSLKRAFKLLPAILLIAAILVGVMGVGMLAVSQLAAPILSGVFGLCFGLLCAPVYIFTGGIGLAVSWWVSGIPYDLLHCVGNFGMALILFVPLRKLLESLYHKLITP